jgi:ubiquinone/menaquinone biosynthesis C-methylase UbiE
VRRSSLSTLRCPACRGELVLEAAVGNELELTQGSLRCVCGNSYPIEDGTPNLIYPDQLLPSDEEFKQKYNEGAELYDAGLDWLFRSFYENENEVRTAMLEMLDLRPGSRVLEVGCGTGKDSLHIISRLQEQGELYAQDISSGMIRIARRRLAGSIAPVEYFLGNAAYLPFEDGYFDSAFHFGGLNTFGEIERSLMEMTRVVRLGGKVVVGDEGVAPWLREKHFGRVLINANPLYKHRPPLECLPENARSVGPRWILGNAFYLIDYRVGDGPPKVDLDLPIPGKGDSLRSRFELRPRK